MCLRAGLVRYCSERGIGRRQRLALYDSLNDAVRATHKFSLMQAYADEVEDAVQYFDIHITMKAEESTGIWLEYAYAEMTPSEDVERPIFIGVHYV